MELRTLSIYSETYNELLSGIRVSQFMKTKQPSNVTVNDVSSTVVPPVDNAEFQKKSCSFCKVEFQDILSQRQHYKLDWHRYNLKLNLKQRKPITEEDFTTKADEDDVSSISGSETESEDDSEPSTVVKGADDIGDLITRRMRMIFENSKGNYLSFSRCWLTDKKDQLQSDLELITTVKKLPHCSQIFVVMLGGGHFAASIFKKNEVIQHKTFHSYTVRAKQGGSQSMKDNKQSASKSAGASLRRYNERSLMQHVQEILANWSKDIAACHFIFIRAVGPNNQSILFSGKQASLQKTDARIRKIPFPTRRATFNETRRVHSLLTSIDVYESETVFQNKFLGWSLKADLEFEIKEKPAVKPPKAKPFNKSKPATLEDSISKSVAQLDIKSDNSEQLSGTENLELSSSEVTTVEQGDKKKVRKKKKKKPEKEPESEPEPHILNFRVNILTSCASGNVDSLREILDSKEDNISGEEVVVAMNQMTTDNLTLLQFAAKNSFNEMVYLILLNGGDPCAKNAKSMTAYDFATEKETRNVFRRFMGDYPDRYDYSKSHIPSALTDDAKERQKAVKKAKRMREKERKKADEPRRNEIAEQKRFLQLDDREKRALAAERRIQASLGKSGKDLVLLRCYRCAINITGKVPFHYENFNFCSMQCLKEHRQSNQSSSNEISR
ncbi:hypothetical protein LSTR_LSTR010665 [Laodelphax striatellus]|uniref:VLRF1 domain-containing protein n=1 Tax=Laodelphax striatellus TaxID=195883 RepID=A0A482WSM5_LAOST|nr:hypothetical protein LSTR_LSTR010665 [Laodelphax striatellus]